jgi:hypothetical protein
MLWGSCGTVALLAGLADTPSGTYKADDAATALLLFCGSAEYAAATDANPWQLAKLLTKHVKRALKNTTGQQPWEFGALTGRRLANMAAQVGHKLMLLVEEAGEMLCFYLRPCNVNVSKVLLMKAVYSPMVAMTTDTGVPDVPKTVELQNRSKDIDDEEWQFMNSFANVGHLTIVCARVGVGGKRTAGFVSSSRAELFSHSHGYTFRQEASAGWEEREFGCDHRFGGQASAPVGDASSSQSSYIRSTAPARQGHAWGQLCPDEAAQQMEERVVLMLAEKLIERFHLRNEADTTAFVNEQAFVDELWTASTQTGWIAARAISRLVQKGKLKRTSSGLQLVQLDEHVRHVRPRITPEVDCSLETLLQDAHGGLFSFKGSAVGLGNGGVFLAGQGQTLIYDVWLKLKVELRSSDTVEHRVVEVHVLPEAVAEAAGWSMHQVYFLRYAP